METNALSVWKRISRVVGGVGRRGKVAAVAVATGALAASANATLTPQDFGDITLPIDPVSMAGAVFLAGAALLIPIMGLWIAFRLVNTGGRKLGGSVK